MPSDLAKSYQVEYAKDEVLERTAFGSGVPAKVLLPFCYHLWHIFVRLETKVGESLLNSASLKWKKKQGVPQFCWLFEFAAFESRYRYQESNRFPVISSG